MVAGRRVRARRVCWISFILDWCRLIVFFFVQRCMLNERNRVGERILFLFYDVKVFIAPFSALRSYDCHVDLTAD